MPGEPVPLYSSPDYRLVTGNLDAQKSSTLVDILYICTLGYLVLNI